jgi:hypothetical protein
MPFALGAIMASNVPQPQSTTSSTAAKTSRPSAKDTIEFAPPRSPHSMPLSSVTHHAGVRGLEVLDIAMYHGKYKMTADQLQAFKEAVRGRIGISVYRFGYPNGKPKPYQFHDANLHIEIFQPATYINDAAGVERAAGTA